MSEDRKRVPLVVKRPEGDVLVGVAIVDDLLLKNALDEANPSMLIPSDSILREVIAGSAYYQLPKEYKDMNDEPNRTGFYRFAGKDVGSTMLFRLDTRGQWWVWSDLTDPVERCEWSYIAQMLIGDERLEKI